jgi:catechol 2,3-dioxygenase-like lactoylglutathione lyase family enzyme
VSEEVNCNGQADQFLSTHFSWQMAECMTKSLLLDLDHVQIAAPKGCETAAREFFGGLLGLEEIEKPERLRSRGGCWFKLGSLQLHIGVEENFQPARKAHPAFTTRQIDFLFAVLAGAGVECVWDRGIPRTRRFHASDPWGNRLEFIESIRTQP